MNIKDAYIHNGEAILKDIQVSGSKLQKLKAGKDANDAYLTWVDVLDFSSFGASGHNHDDLYLKLTGGTMSGDITFPYEKGLIYNLSTLSNYARSMLLLKAKKTTSAADVSNVFALGYRVAADGYKYTYIGGGSYDSDNNLRFNADNSITVGANVVYHAGNLNIGTLMGSTAIGDSDEPVYWNGTAFVKAGAYPTKSSWNYDDVYLKLAGGTLTGALNFKYGTNNGDQLIKFASNDTTDSQAVYLGIRRPADTYGLSYKDTAGTFHKVYHDGNLTIATLVGSTAIGDADEPVYWSGSAFVKAGAYPTKSSWNYDDVYLKDVLLDTGNATDKNKSVSLTNGNVYLKLFKTVNGAEAEDSKVKIYGDTNISVTTDGSGDIKITGTTSVTSATYAANVGAAGTAGSDYVTAANVISMYSWYSTITATDEASNTAIDKWQEILDFLAGITDTSTLSGILAGYAAASHTHYIGTTQVQATSAAQDLTGIKDSTFSGVMNITGRQSYAEGIRIHDYSGISSIWFRAVNADNYDAGMIGITGSSAGLRFRLPASATGTSPTDYVTIAYGGATTVAGTFTASNKVYFTGLSEGTSDVTADTEILTSYAGASGFANTTGAGQVYRRQASKLYNYIKTAASGDWTINSAKVKTIKSTTNATYYLTFVDSNNTTATAETVYTSANITFNPSTSNLAVTTAANQNMAFKEVRTGGASVSMGVGSGNKNHGVYSNSLSKWLIYADSSDTTNKKVYVNNTSIPESATLLTTSNYGTTLNSVYVRTNPGAAEQTIESSIGTYAKGIVEFYRSSGDHIAFITFSNKLNNAKRVLGSIGFHSGGVGKLQYRSADAKYYDIINGSNLTTYIVGTASTTLSTSEQTLLTIKSGESGSLSSTTIKVKLPETNPYPGYIGKTAIQTTSAEQDVDGIGKLNVKGLGKDRFILHPIDGEYYEHASPVTGYLKITLPNGYNSALMIRFNVDIYDYYADRSCSYYICGYIYTNAQWLATTAYSLSGNGSAFGNLPVKFGHDGTKAVVWIGNADTEWNYPHVAITNVMGSFNDTNSGYSKLISGWVISFDTSEPTNVTVTKTNSGYTYGAHRLAGGTAGSIPYQTGAGTTAMLAGSGTNGYILSYNTSTGTPQWVSPGGTHNHDDLYLKLTGGTMTGVIERQYNAASNEPVLKIGSANKDIQIFKVYSNDIATYSDTVSSYGYALQYIGSGSGVSNYLRLIADNSTGTKKTAMSINQSGQVGILADPNTSYALYVNGATNINGDITASSFKKSGGTSSQFLKADGSVDSNSYALSTHNHNSLDIVPIMSKTYDGTEFYATSAGNWDLASRFFMSVIPEGADKYWRVKYHIKVWVPSSNLMTDSIVEYYGSGITMKAYKIWNTHGPTHATYYHVALWLKSAGLSAGYGHLIGESILYATSYTTAASYRHMTVDLLEYEGCTVNMIDTAVKYTNWTGYSSTNYNSISSYNATSDGLQETGDSDDLSIVQQTYTLLQAGANGIKGYSLVMQDDTGKWQSIHTSAVSTGTTKTVNTAKFRLDSNVYYMSRSSDLAADSYLGTSQVRVFSPNIDFRYSLNNVTANGTGLTAYKPIYLVGTLDSDGYFKLDTNYWTQTAPTTADGKIYIKVCEAVYLNYSTNVNGSYSGDFGNFGIYQFKNGRLQKFTNYAVNADKLNGFSASDFRNNIIDLRTSPQTFNPTYLKDIVFISEADYGTLVSNGSITKNDITHTYNLSNWYVIEDKVPEYAEEAGNATYASYANLVDWSTVNSSTAWEAIAFGDHNTSQVALHHSAVLRFCPSKNTLFVGTNQTGLSTATFQYSDYGVIAIGDKDHYISVDGDMNFISNGTMYFKVNGDGGDHTIYFTDDSTSEQAYLSAYLNWTNVTDKPDCITWEPQTSTDTYSLSNGGWTQTITLPTTKGSYMLQLSTGSGNTESYLTGVFSISGGDTMKDEISLHLHGKGKRLYARTNGTKLELSSNDATAASISVTIKYRRMI